VKKKQTEQEFTPIYVQNIKGNGNPNDCLFGCSRKAKELNQMVDERLLRKFRALDVLRNSSMAEYIIEENEIPKSYMKVLKEYEKFSEKERGRSNRFRTSPPKKAGKRGIE
jgi:hypothetical protein